MPQCSAYGCSTGVGKGKKLHRFPREQQRRKIWEQRVKRKNWVASDFSLLCEDHFDESQYERGRADGLRKLKPNAIPTLFIFTPPKVPGRSTKRSVTQDQPCPDGQERIQRDHSYCCTKCSTSLEVQKDIQVDHDQFDLTDNTCSVGAVSEETVSRETACRDNQLNTLKKQVSSLQWAKRK
ncbi:THAP domain-containing protein 2-like [Mugil cephalus]|uniref:THAP domain-containing protein 2-like n=1 Tax=Mugil cephalus TaxID=48193 RepID=UPI001FB660D0|nr:THAP domain-containing protein 2-like [Mugil cephalus]